MKQIDPRRLSAPVSNIFFSETLNPPWEVGKKVYINGTSHMNKMADMHIYGKNLYKSSSPEAEVL